MCIFWSKPLVLAFRLSQSWPHPLCCSLKKTVGFMCRRAEAKEEEEEEVQTAQQSDCAVRWTSDGQFRATRVTTVGRLVLRGHSKETAAAAEGHSRSAAWPTARGQCCWGRCVCVLTASVMFCCKQGRSAVLREGQGASDHWHPLLARGLAPHCPPQQNFSWM